MGQQSPLPVIVTGVGGGGHGEQVLKALRLAPTHYRIIGTDMTMLSAGLADADHSCLLPPASDCSYIARLVEVARAHDVVAVFHGSEPELRAMSKARNVLTDAGLFVPINTVGTIELCMDKFRTASELHKLGFKTPAFRKISTVAEAVEFPVFPAVLKPSTGGGGSAHVFLAQTRDEVLSAAIQLLAVHKDFIMQEYVGRCDQEYTVGVLTDMDGNLVNSIAVRRYILSSLSNRIKVPNRTDRSDLGPVLAISNGISQGEIGKFSEVTGICEKIALALNSRGPMNIQCRLVGNQVFVFEINPRFSGTTSLRAMVGFNEPDWLIRKHVLGEEMLIRFPYQEGVVLRGLSERLVQGAAWQQCQNMFAD